MTQPTTSLPPLRTQALRPVFCSTLAAVLVLGVAATAAHAADGEWPQWRGPERDGRSPETGLLSSWPEGGPPLAWRAGGLGSGYSSVSVAEGRIHTMGDLGDGQSVIALDREGGKHLWKTRIGPTWEDEYLGPRSTPTADGERLYALSTEGDLVCLDAADGKVVWSRSLAKDFGGALMLAQGSWSWKFSESPLVDGDRVIVTPGARTAALVALDKTTGEEIWRAAVPALGEAGADGAGYSSVVVSSAGGVRQYVQFLGRGVVGIEAATGHYLWGYNRVANGIANIATPLVAGDRVFASSGYGTGSALIEVKKGEEGAFTAREVYFLEPGVMQNHHGGLILHEGYVYTGSGHNKGLPVAVELASGEVAWGPVRTDGRASAAIAYAEGHLYLRYQDGLMVLAEATPEAFRQKGSFKIPEVRRESWAHPVIAGGHLYLREQENLFVYDLRKGAEPPPKPAPASSAQGR